MANPPGPPLGEPAAHAASLTGMVDYQSGGIVSRQLLKKPAGNVTLFAFDQQQELAEHTSPFDALVLVIEGEAEISVAGAPHPVRAGETILLPAHVPHAVKAIARFKMLLTMIRA
jgi:quercetin dioxygenase-like cupin family protein